MEMFGICRDDPSITASSRIRYDACISVTPDDYRHRLTCQIPRGIYLRAVHKGPFNQLTQSYNYLIYEWCPLYQLPIDYRTAPFEQFILSRPENVLKTTAIVIHIPLKQR